MNTEVPEAAHSLHKGLIDARGLLVALLLCTDAHYQLNCPADVQEEVVHLVPVPQIFISPAGRPSHCCQRSQSQ